MEICGRVEGADQTPAAAERTAVLQALLADDNAQVPVRLFVDNLPIVSRPKRGLELSMVQSLDWWPWCPFLGGLVGSGDALSLSMASFANLWDPARDYVPDHLAYILPISCFLGDFS